MIAIRTDSLALGCRAPRALPRRRGLPLRLDPFLKGPRGEPPGGLRRRDQVDDREDHDPDDVDEVPVEPDHLDREGGVLRERCRGRRPTSRAASGCRR